MSRRDIMFYLAVFVALATSATTAANVRTIAEFRTEVSEQDEQIAALTVERDELLAEMYRLDDLMEQGNRDGMEEYWDLADAYNEPAWTSGGEFRIYHYCPCELCTGKKPGDRGYGIKATGAVATEGRTVAVDPDIIPLGSEVLINGIIYIAEDSGVKGKTIDIFVGSHEQALAMGTYRTAVSWR